MASWIGLIIVKLCDVAQVDELARCNLKTEHSRCCRFDDLVMQILYSRVVSQGPTAQGAVLILGCQYLLP